VNLLTALSRKSDDVVYRAKLVPAQQVLGRLLAVQGRDAEARSQLQAAAAAADALLRYEPDNRRWADNAATVHLALAQQFFSAGNYAASSPELERGCTLAEQALRASPTTERRLGDWQCEHLRGRLALASRQADRALAHAQRAVAVARAQRSGDALSDRYLMARSLLLQGDVLHGRGQADAARQSWQAGAHLANAKLEQPWESAVRGELLLRVGRTSDANAIFAGLARRGIRNRNMLRV
jgi:tetratricopeptide (TPR) repeat protein